MMANRRTIDFHEGNPEAVRDVFHQRRFTVTGWRDQKEQSHEVGPFIFTDNAHLLGEVISNQWQVHLINESIPDERGEDSWTELIETQIVLLFLKQNLFQFNIGFESGDGRLFKVPQPLEEIVVIQ